MPAPLAIVAGVGPGNGTTLARRSRADGYRLALLARGTEYGNALATEIGEARAYACDVGDAASVHAAMAAVRRAADLVRQDRSAWSFEVEAWPFGETW